MLANAPDVDRSTRTNRPLPEERSKADVADVWSLGLPVRRVGLEQECMNMEAPRPSLLGGYRPGLRSVVGASATAYGYTLTVGPTSMLLTHGYGPPEPLEVLLFCGGAILAFALVGALAFGGVSGHFGDHPKKIQLWGSFHFLSVGLAVVAAYLVGAFVPSALGWPLGAFAATATYLMVVGFENAAADLERRKS